MLMMKEKEREMVTVNVNVFDWDCQVIPTENTFSRVPLEREAFYLQSPGVNNGNSFVE